MDPQDLPPIAEELTLTLRKPVKYADQEYAMLNLREPTAGELAKAMKESGEVDMMIALIHQVAAVPRGVAERISQRDMGECARFFGQFSRVQESA
ncbi:MAG: phage tail assembly protein [Burkholderiales bacterium]|jgi:hypothetical protein|nr:phage tail assembly protein [Burkholderiales bacterium]